MDKPREGSPATRISDRRLGSSWKNWDGSVEAHEGELRESPALFLALGGLATLAAFAIALAILYFIRANHLLLFLAAVVWLPYALLLLHLAVRQATPLSGILSWSCVAAAKIFAKIFAFSGLSRDRIFSSCIAANNLLNFPRLDARTAARPMLLLPRCLSRDAFAKSQALAAKLGVPPFIAATNEIARSRIRETAPTMLIAVACERDLVRGISDYGVRMPVLVIANRRPQGPCLNTEIAMEELETFVSKVLASK